MQPTSLQYFFAGCSLVLDGDDDTRSSASPTTSCSFEPFHSTCFTYTLPPAFPRIPRRHSFLIRAMPAPYSDNLYSGDDNPWAEDEQQQRQQNDEQQQQHDDNSALSPADGYFHASSSGPEEAATSSSHYTSRQSSSVPFVPNVMVEDPTLHEDRAAAKAREAAEESRINSAAAAAGASTPFEHRQPHHQPSAQAEASFHQPSHSHPFRAPPPSQAAAYPPFQAHRHQASSSSSSSASPSGHHHRRSIDEEVSSFQPSSSMGRPADQYTVHRQTDAPPAYSPSASSPPLSSSYQTFSPPQAAAQSDSMGVPEENQSLLPRQPESMGGPPNGSQETLWRRIKRHSATRKRVRTFLGVLLILSIVTALLGSTISISNSDRVSICLRSTTQENTSNM